MLHQKSLSEQRLKSPPSSHLVSGGTAFYNFWKSSIRPECLLYVCDDEKVSNIWTSLSRSLFCSSHNLHLFLCIQMSASSLTPFRNKCPKLCAIWMIITSCPSLWWQVFLPRLQVCPFGVGTKTFAFGCGRATLCVKEVHFKLTTAFGVEVSTNDKLRRINYFTN